ncbi:MAG: right-handed parallel beta-helix repeat-containing protein [Phycisphaerales bacterium]
MTIPSSRCLIVALASSLVAAATASAFGPLDPPAGAVAPTGKTTQELYNKIAKTEPRIAINSTNTPGGVFGTFEITAPGSYYLEADVVQGANTTGIAIGASNVTIDLNGFMVRGSGSGPGTGIRMYLDGQSNITILNGTVTQCGSIGINISVGAPQMATIRNVRFIANSAGIRGGDRVTIEDCTVDGNTTDGISVRDFAVIRNCVARNNGGVGIVTVTSGVVQSCSAATNAGIGISVGTGSQVIDCTSNNNTGAGIFANNALLIRACTATANTGGGISALTGSAIHGCSALGNQNFGIAAVNQCELLNNTCTNNLAGASNPGGGIMITGSRNRLEGNHTTGNVRGVDITGTLNWVGRHTAGGNTGANYVIGVNNAVAPIVPMTLNPVPISGGSYLPAGGPTATDPNTNFSF